MICHPGLGFIHETIFNERLKLLASSLVWFGENTKYSHSFLWVSAMLNIDNDSMTRKRHSGIADGRGDSLNRRRVSAFKRTLNKSQSSFPAQQTKAT
jgi:hypothetical protein